MDIQIENKNGSYTVKVGPHVFGGLTDEEVFNAIEDEATLYSFFGEVLPQGYDCNISGCKRGCVNLLADGKLAIENVSYKEALDWAERRDNHLVSQIEL